MREINRLLLIGFAKIIFVFLPIAAALFFGCYFVEHAIIARGLKSVAFVPGLLSAALLFYLAKLLIGEDLKKIAKLRGAKKGR